MAPLVHPAPEKKRAGLLGWPFRASGAICSVATLVACGRASQSPNEERESLPRLSCTQVESAQFDAANMRAYQLSEEVEHRVDDLFSRLDATAKALQLVGVPRGEKDYDDLHRGQNAALPGFGTLRGYHFRDGGRGVNLDDGQENRQSDGLDFSTSFPTASLRAATWDLDLERRIGEAMGDETVASKNNALIAPCVNVVRHPYWGRTQESYGEDSYLVGRMATALTVGIQKYVLACARHFLAYNIEKDRTRQNAILSEQALREVYGRHFEMVVRDAGIGCVLAAHNAVNGVKMTQNRHLLHDVLKGPTAAGGMGFAGFVVSDWWAMPGEQEGPQEGTASATSQEALFAGLDVEMPWTLHFSEATLKDADQTLVEEAAKRVVTQKVRFGSAMHDDPWGLIEPTSVLEESGSLQANEAHEALAEEAALEGIVLLTNGLGDQGPVLPLSVNKLAVIGLVQEVKIFPGRIPPSCDHIEFTECHFRFAEEPALGDRGASRVNADYRRFLGPHQGIATIAGPTREVTVGHTAESAMDAEAVVVVVGYTAGDEGEEYPTMHGGDRASLDLPPGHNELVQSVLDQNKPTVIVIESGSIVNVPWLSHPNQKQATIWAGYPGQLGGLALGKLIWGEANFGGKLPMAWPREHELAPFRDSEFETEMGYFFGYREYDRRKYVAGLAVDLVFPFGHGLSYSTFEYSNLVVPCETASPEAIFAVTIDITNTSQVAGDEVVQLFVRPPARTAEYSGERPHKELKSFARVHVPAGQTVTAELPLRIQDLRRWEGGPDGNWVIDRGEYTLVVAKDAEDAETTTHRAPLLLP